MANNYFNFKQFTVNQEGSAFKVGTDGVLLGAYADIAGARNILDIGTGTGLLALMLAQRSDARVTAIEPDAESYRQACENVSTSKWSDRIEVVHTDLQSFKPGVLKYDLIVTNPPFFSDSLKNPDKRKSASRHAENLTPEVIIDCSMQLLATGGQLQLILPVYEGNVLIGNVKKSGFYLNKILNIRTLENSKVKRLILTFSTIPAARTENTLVIETSQRHRYTEDYINLTKDFYLKF